MIGTSPDVTKSNGDTSLGVTFQDNTNQSLFASFQNTPQNKNRYHSIRYYDGKSNESESKHEDSKFLKGLAIGELVIETQPAKPGTSFQFYPAMD